MSVKDFFSNLAHLKVQSKIISITILHLTSDGKVFCSLFSYSRSSSSYYNHLPMHGGIARTFLSTHIFPETKSIRKITFLQ